MAITYKDIGLLTQKATLVGTEKIPVSDTQYITPSQITESSLPAVTSSDNGKSLVVDGGIWGKGLGAGNELLGVTRRIVSGYPLYRYKLCGIGNSRKAIPLVITDQTTSSIVTKTPSTARIVPFYGIYFYDSTTSVTLTTVSTSGFCDEHPAVPATYTFNGTIANEQEVYLKGTFDVTTNLFSLDTESDTSWYMSVAKNLSAVNYYSAFESGAYYIFVGETVGVNVLHLHKNNPLLYFNGDHLIPVNPDSRIDSTPTENSTNPITSGAVYTALGNIETLINAL